MLDDRVGGLEDVAVRAVVLFEADHLLHAELALEVAHVADFGAAEGIDRLVVVADGEQFRPIVGTVVGQQLQPGLYCSTLVSWNSSTRM